MEKPEILKKFLDNGLQLDFESLDFFFHNPKQVDIFLQKIPSIGKPPTVTIGFINEVLRNAKGEVEIIKVPKKTKTSVGIEDLAAFVNNRYAFMRKILKERAGLVNLISINKVAPKVKHFSSIIIVKEKFEKENSIIGEDETGECEFLFKKQEDFEQLMCDDIVGIVCENSGSGEGRIKVERIIWPDLPLKREVVKINEDLMLVVTNSTYLSDSSNLNNPNNMNSNLSSDQNNRQNNQQSNLTTPVTMSGVEHNRITITAEDQKGKVNSTLFDLPATIMIRNSIVILISDSSNFKKYQQFENDAQNFLVSLLRRRSLHPTIEPDHAGFSNDPFLIDTVPDIFIVFGTKNSGSINYKGTTIVTLSDPKVEMERKEKAAWVINLKTREATLVAATLAEGKATERERQKEGDQNSA